MSKKINVVISTDLETLKILESLEIDAGDLLAEVARIKLKEWQEKWKEENKEGIEEMNRFIEKHGHFRPE
ncbi:type II toxin-antitoxin system CcdA family antitoxin [Shigella flexneri]